MRTRLFMLSAMNNLLPFEKTPCGARSVLAAAAPPFEGDIVALDAEVRAEPARSRQERRVAVKARPADKAVSVILSPTLQRLVRELSPEKKKLVAGMVSDMVGRLKR